MNKYVLLLGIFLLFCVPSVISYNSWSYKIPVSLDNQQVQIGEVTFDYARIPIFDLYLEENTPDLYTIKSFDMNDTEIYSYNFTLSGLIIYSPTPDCIIPYNISNETSYNITSEYNESNISVYDVENCGEVEFYTDSKKDTFDAYVPFFGIEKEVKVYNNQGLVLATTNLERFQDYCGDGICSARESYLICSLDCESETIPILPGQEFYTSSGHIKGNENFNVYVQMGLCSEQSNCLEVIGNNQVNMQNLQNNEYTLTGTEEYNLIVSKIQDDTKVNVLTDVGNALVSKNSLAVSGDWTTFNSIEGSYISDEGLTCKYVFNPNLEQIVQIIC